MSYIVLKNQDRAIISNLVRYFLGNSKCVLNAVLSRADLSDYFVYILTFKYKGILGYSVHVDLKDVYAFGRFLNENFDSSDNLIVELNEFLEESVVTFRVLEVELGKSFKWIGGRWVYPLIVTIKDDSLVFRHNMFIHYDIDTQFTPSLVPTKDCFFCVIRDSLGK